MGIGNNLRLDNLDFETIPTKVCRVIRQAILNGELQPGQRLVQDELANSIGVSRMPIREAFKQLETEGLIIIEPHKGAFVRTFSIDEVQEIYYLRSIFEKEAVKDSVENMNGSVISRLEELVEEMGKTSNIEDFVKINIQFHSELMSCCQMNKLKSFIENLWSGFPQHTPYLLPNQIGTSNSEHREILKAVKENDSLKAGDLISQHISRVGKGLIPIIDSKGKYIEK
ncbi:GntR family transcriptional regulator [Psychrobacillus antarcticus]|uniref:GntR family transcriptional regulator n=1 Tax=Psychrobacillus antarcticus TaxID=2879115 RepID=UPI0024086C63|nr:GntR family transcriptional regulator [Psychrobacillus antarcticus]